MPVSLPVIQARTCGECAVCCIFVSIAELNKPARVPCSNLESSGYGCTIYNAGRPQVCKDFKCSWLLGAGREEDRPDRIGVMLTVQDIQDGRYALALETRPGAVAGPAAHVVSEVARLYQLPVIVSDFESLPPDDKGDRVAVHTSILYQSRRLIGPLLKWLGPNVALYDLVKGAN